MKFLRQSLTGLFLLSLTLGILAVAGNMVFSAIKSAQSQQGFRPPARERVFAVNVVTAKVESIAPTLTAFGEVASTRTLEIRATTGGQVVFLAPEFRDGGQVETGQLLVRVDQVDALAQLDRVKTDILDAEAEVRDANRAFEIATDDLKAAEEQSQLRDKALARQQDLRERGVGTEAAVEQAELSASSSRAAVLGKRQALANAAARVDQAQTRMARQQISLDDATRALSETEMFAGFSGTLSGATAIAGGLVSPNEKLAELIDRSSLEVSFRISTAQYARLLDQNGQLQTASVEVSLDVGGVELVSSGEIERESAAVGDGQTGRLIYARIDNPIGLKPGDFVTVKIQEPTVDGITRLPATAYGNDGAVLTVSEEDRLVSVDVALVRRQADDVLVQADALDGARVVAERTPLLGAGIGVRVLEPAEAEAIAASGEQRQPSSRPQGQGQPSGGEDGEMIEISDERRQKLIEAVKSNARMPADAKDRILATLEQPEVPKEMVERLESRMGN